MLAFMAPSPMELVVILVIALLVLGPKRLPDTARSLGRGLREFKDSLQGIADGDDRDAERHAQALEPAAARRDDPGGLPVDPAVVMGAQPFDDDLPDRYAGADDLSGDGLGDDSAGAAFAGERPNDDGAAHAQLDDGWPDEPSERSARDDA